MSIYIIALFNDSFDVHALSVTFPTPFLKLGLKYNKMQYRRNETQRLDFRRKKYAIISSYTLSLSIARLVSFLTMTCYKIQITTINKKLFVKRNYVTYLLTSGLILSSISEFQVPVYVIEYENRHFRPDVHVRFHSSDQKSDQIRTYLWPALREGTNGPCVQKGVVIT